MNAHAQPNRCDAIRESLMPLLHDELDPEAAGQAREHLQTCPACAAEMESLNGALETLRTDRPPAIPKQTWDTISRRVASDLAAAPAQPPVAQIRPAPLPAARQRVALRIGWAAAAAVAVAALLVYLITPPVVGAVASIEGDATLSGEASLRTGQPVRAGNELATGASGQVVLKMLDGSRITLRAGSRLLVEKRGEMALQAGSLRADMKPQEQRFRIVTRHAIAEVVGTKFDLATTQTETTLTVQEGEVRFYTRNGKTLFATSAGQTAVADAGVGIRTLLPDPEPSRPIALALHLRKLPGKPARVEVSVSCDTGTRRIGRLNKDTTAVRFFLLIRKEGREEDTLLKLLPKYTLDEPGSALDVRIDPKTPYRFTIALGLLPPGVFDEAGSYRIRAAFTSNDGQPLKSVNEITVTTDNEETGN